MVPQLEKINLIFRGDYHYHRKVIKRIRKLFQGVAILFDTNGPEIRTAVLDGPIHLKKGETIILTNKKTELARKAIHQTYNRLWKDVGKGNTEIMQMDEPIVGHEYWVGY